MWKSGLIFRCLFIAILEFLYITFTITGPFLKIVLLYLSAVTILFILISFQLRQEEIDCVPGVRQTLRCREEHKDIW